MIRATKTGKSGVGKRGDGVRRRRVIEPTPEYLVISEAGVIVSRRATFRDALTAAQSEGKCTVCRVVLTVA